MSNHATPTDLLAAKVKELIKVVNDRGLSFKPIEPLLGFDHLDPPIEVKREVKYPDFSRAKVDHSKLGS